jgi:hypothetical protein
MFAMFPTEGEQCRIGEMPFSRSHPVLDSISGLESKRDPQHCRSVSARLREKIRKNTLIASLGMGSLAP